MMSSHSTISLLTLLGLAGCSNANTDFAPEMSPVVAPAPQAAPPEPAEIAPAPAPETSPGAWRTVQLESFLDSAGGPVMYGSIALPEHAVVAAHLETEELIPIIDIDIDRIHIGLGEGTSRATLEAFRKSMRGVRFEQTETLPDGFVAVYSHEGQRAVYVARGLMSCDASNLVDDPALAVALRVCRSLTPGGRPQGHPFVIPVAHLPSDLGAPRAIEITLPPGFTEAIDPDCDADEQVLASRSFEGEGLAFYVEMRDADTAVANVEAQETLIRSNHAGAEIRFTRVPQGDGSWALFYQTGTGSGERYAVEVVEPAFRTVCGGALFSSRGDAERVAAICNTLRADW